MREAWQRLLSVSLDLMLDSLSSQNMNCGTDADTFRPKPEMTVTRPATQSGIKGVTVGNNHGRRFRVHVAAPPGTNKSCYGTDDS
jgi:hypothetical protein